MEISKDWIKAQQWALAGSHLKAYAVPVKETYTERVNRSGKKPYKATIHYCKICIEIGNAKHYGKEQYKQDSSLANKIKEIYLHYYNQRKI